MEEEEKVKLFRGDSPTTPLPQSEPMRTEECEKNGGSWVVTYLLIGILVGGALTCALLVWLVGHFHWVLPNGW